MRCLRRAILRCMLTLLLACAAPGAPSGGADPGPSGSDDPAETAAELPVLDLVDALDAAVAQNHGSGGGLMQVLSLDGRLVWSGASGEAVRGEDGAMSPDLGFEVASNTKTVTAATALLLAEDGLLDLDRPISDVLPERLTDGLLVIDGHDYGPALTARQLLAQTSGLPDYWSDPPFVRPGINAFLVAFLADEDRLWEPEELIGYAADLTPIAAPGAGWHYSDTNYVLLGLMIEQITGEALHDVMRARIFQPLGMKDTWMSFHEDPRGDAALSHRYEDRTDITVQTRQSADWAGGGLVSTAADLSALMAALAEDRLFAARSTGEAMLQSTQTDWGADVTYGLGVIQVTLDDGLGTLWGHEGYGSSFMYVWPEQRLIFVGTLNQTSNDPWGLLGQAVGQVVAQR